MSDGKPSTTDFTPGPWTRSGLSNHQHDVLRRPWLYDARRTDHRQLLRLGLLERCCGDTFTTPEGRSVRELEPNDE